jgi:hypothetical protein
MACLAVPAPPLPTLPFPLTLGAEIPGFSFDPELCCKILPFPVGTPPIPLGPGVFNPAVVAVINSQLALMNAYFDALSFECPLE